MTAERFLNACKILIDFSWHDLLAAGVVRDNPHGHELYEVYLRTPIVFLCRLDEYRLEALWRLIEARQQS